MAQGRGFTDPDWGDSGPRGSSLPRGSSQKRELVYTAPGKELKWWRPTRRRSWPWACAAYSDIPALKALEHYFDSQASFQNDTQKEANLEPIFEKAQTSLSRRRRRELERRASLPRD